MDSNETEARRELVEVARHMLSREISFHEGANRILKLRTRIRGLPDRDDDFDAFVVICSETEHLPLAAQRSLWSAKALERLAGEFERVEVWASAFAPEACRNLIARFERHD